MFMWQWVFSSSPLVFWFPSLENMAFGWLKAPDCASVTGWCVCALWWTGNLTSASFPVTAGKCSSTPRPWLRMQIVTGRWLLSWLAGWLDGITKHLQWCTSESRDFGLFLCAQNLHFLNVCGFFLRWSLHPLDQDFPEYQLCCLLDIVAPVLWWLIIFLHDLHIFLKFRSQTADVLFTNLIPCNN